MKNINLKSNFKYLLSFIAIPLLSSWTYSQTNLIVDSSFENGSTAWALSSGATRITTNPQSGSFSVNALDNSGATQTINDLTPNTTYLLTGWLRSSNSAVVRLGVRRHGGNELTVQTASTSYVQLSIKFTTGPASTTAIIYCSNPAGGSNQMIADNLSLLETAETPYTLVWSDEFNGTGAVNTANWNFENGFVRNNEDQWYQPDNASQKDGNLIIEARKEPVWNQRRNPNFVAGGNWPAWVYYINYTSSSINSRNKQSWLYGRFEIRAKVTNLLGTWPAIWTLGNSCNWPSNGEVDIMENYTGGILGNFAYGTNTAWQAKWDSAKLPVSDFIKKDPNWVSKFHIWTLDWDYNRMSIYVDGTLVNEIDLNTTINGSAACSGENPFRKRQYLLLNLALGGNSGGSITNLTFPNQYLVDYVRVYQISPTLAVNKVDKQDETSIYPNPAKDVFTINYPYSNPKFTVFDVSGRVLITGSSSKVEVSKLEKGVYFVQVENLKAIKFIKE